MITSYCDNRLSYYVSFNNTPSVNYLILVIILSYFSSNLTEYPTSLPNSISISSATLLATFIADILRGWVTATHFLDNLFSKINCGSCVVFPDPVSPCTIII
jgi:hypothetical protein